MPEESERQTTLTSEQVIRRTISRPADRNAGQYIYLGEPTQAVLDRVAGKIGKAIPDFTGKLNTDAFLGNAASNICECDCFCSCSCDCTCNCDCVCYCECNCPCLCQSACDDALLLQDIRNLTRKMDVLRERINVRYGQITEIMESLTGF